MDSLIVRESKGVDTVVSAEENIHCSMRVANLPGHYLYSVIDENETKILVLPIMKLEGNALTFWSYLHDNDIWMFICKKLSEKYPRATYSDPFSVFELWNAIGAEAIYDAVGRDVLKLS